MSVKDGGTTRLDSAYRKRPFRQNEEEKRNVSSFKRQALGDVGGFQGPRAVLNDSEAPPFDGNAGFKVDFPKIRQQERIQNSEGDNFGQNGYLKLQYQNGGVNLDTAYSSHRNENNAHVRILITTREAGMIIGKHGKIISGIRTESGARLVISEQTPGNSDRILTISGTPDTILKAVLLAARIIADDPQNHDSRKSSVKSAIIRLLVLHINMGVIIGKSGSKIRDIQERSSTRILAGEEILPNSVERIVTIIGLPESIQVAVSRIFSVLYSHIDDHSFDAYKPQSANMQNARTQLPRNLHPDSHVSFPMQPAYLTHAPNYNLVGANQNYYDMNRAPISIQTLHSAPYNPVQFQQIFIPKDMAGSIIGKQGSKINEIRQISGCHIKIAAAQQPGPDRLVTIIGSTDSIRTALFLLCGRLEDEKSRKEILRDSTQCGTKI